MAMRNWIIKKADEEKVSRQCERWGISKVCASILVSRGIEDEKEVSEFLNLPEFLDPSEFSDMEKTVEYLTSAIESHEKICVYGDYDADGVTSTALIYSYLKSKGADVIYYIPDREKEGYGLNCEAVENLLPKGLKFC